MAAFAVLAMTLLPRLLLLRGGDAAPLLPSNASAGGAANGDGGGAISAAADGWEELRAVIDGFSLVPDAAISVGDARGMLFRHTKGNSTFETSMSIASSTKWVSATAIMALVESGLGGLSLDDLAFERLEYWTRDPSDPRSRVTLRHLLSFVSGMSGSTACPAEQSFLQCVEHMYTSSASTGEPGAAVVYNEVHLMYAGAMASEASGLPIEQIFERFVFDPAAMGSTSWSGAGRPLLGSGLITTPADYERFLDAYFNGRLVTPETRAEMERSHYPQAQLSGVAVLQGRYGLGNWFQCIPSVPDFRDQCQQDDVHMSIGARGYYPSTDRRLKFWLNIGTSSPAGAATSTLLQLILQPLAGAAVVASRGTPLDSSV